MLEERNGELESCMASLSWLCIIVRPRGTVCKDPVGSMLAYASMLTARHAWWQLQP